MRKLFKNGAISGIVALLAAALCGNASADTVNFSVAPGFEGGSVNGFTFSSNWNNWGSGGSTEPFMEWWDQPHSVTYDAGTFTFNAMSLSGWPWTDYGGGTGTTLSFDFKDGGGNVIASNSMELTLDDQFHTFTQTVSGVSEIYFNATNGFWPRMASIDMNVSPVPEPETYAMLLAGLGLLGFAARRRQRKLAAA